MYGICPQPASGERPLRLAAHKAAVRDLRCGSHEDQEDVHFGDNDDVTIPFVTLLAAEFVAMVSTMALVLWLLALLFVVIADIFVVCC